MTLELRCNMAAPCAASEVAVSVKAERSSSISSHVAPLHHCVQVWMHALKPNRAPTDSKFRSLTLSAPLSADCPRIVW